MWLTISINGCVFDMAPAHPTNVARIMQAPTTIIIYDADRNNVFPIISEMNILSATAHTPMPSIIAPQIWKYKKIMDGNNTINKLAWHGNQAHICVQM